MIMITIMITITIAIAKAKAIAIVIMIMIIIVIIVIVIMQNLYSAISVSSIAPRAPLKRLRQQPCWAWVKCMFYTWLG